MTLGNDNGTDGQTDRRTDRQTDRRTDRVRRNMRPPPREEGRITNEFDSGEGHIYRGSATTLSKGSGPQCSQFLDPNLCSYCLT